MNKAELISKLSDDAGVTKTQANAALDSFVEAVTKTLKGGGKVTLVGFGTFSVSKRAARNGRNPQTGAVIKIKAKKVARFKAGKELQAKLYLLPKPAFQPSDSHVRRLFYKYKRMV
jgi:DNA-binding protein HU-beta